MSQQPIDTNCMTITRFFLAEQRKFPDAHGDLSQLLTSIQSAVKVIGTLVQTEYSDRPSIHYLPISNVFSYALYKWSNFDIIEKYPVQYP